MERGGGAAKLIFNDAGMNEQVSTRGRAGVCTGAWPVQNCLKTPMSLPGCFPQCVQRTGVPLTISHFRRESPSLPPSLPPFLPFCTVSRSVSPPLSSSLSGLPSKFLRPPSFPFCTWSRSVRPSLSSCLGPPPTFLLPAFQSPTRFFFVNPRTRHLPPSSCLAN